MEAFLVLHRAAGSSETERGTGRLGQVGASRRGSVSWRPGESPLHRTTAQQQRPRLQAAAAHAALPAHGCSQGSFPGTAPSSAALLPAGAHPGHSTPAARASQGAAPGSGSRSQNLQVLKRHNRRTEMEGKHRQRTAEMKGLCSVGKQPSVSPVVLKNHPRGHGHPEQHPWVFHTSAGASWPLTVTMRVFQATEKTSVPSSPQ